MGTQRRPYSGQARARVGVEVQVPDGNVDEPEEGCVAIMFGSKDD